MYERVSMRMLKQIEPSSETKGIFLDLVSYSCFDELLSACLDHLSSFDHILKLDLKDRRSLMNALAIHYINLKIRGIEHIHVNNLIHGLNQIANKINIPSFWYSSENKDLTQ